MHPNRLRRRIPALLAGMPAVLAAGLPGPSIGAELRRIVCPFGPGGISDLLSRAMATELQAYTGQDWLVENVPGAGGQLGAIRVARSEPDGRTLLKAGTGTFRTLGGRATRANEFDPLRDLRAIAVVGTMPLLIVARRGAWSARMRDSFDRLRAARQAFTYATIGIGSTPHVCGALLASLAGIEGLHVPYKGSAEVVNAVLAGEVPFAVVDPMLVAPRLASGDLVALALSSNRRNPQLPDVATLSEQGFADFDLSTWLGFFAPAATPGATLAMLAVAFRQALEAEPLRRTLRSGFLDGRPIFGADAQRFVTEDVHAFQRWMRDLGIRVD